ncbi:MAG: hypothetical protein IPJ37_18295 [Bacteroidales bacterium]|nr:hypothetical protein [Bacteroidales bacterium]
MQKAKRLLAIESIITEVNIPTQEELLKRLKGKGISCTQATLSRNLRQLGLAGYLTEQGITNMHCQRMSGILPVLP